MNNRIIASGVVTLAVMVSLAAAPVMANSKNQDDSFGYGYRPGWGFGDKNHVHTGPPGQVGKDDSENGHPHGVPPGLAKKFDSEPEGDEFTWPEFDEEVAVQSDDLDRDDSGKAHPHGGPPGQVKKSDNDANRPNQVPNLSDDIDDDGEDRDRGTGKSNGNSRGKNKR